MENHEVRKLLDQLQRIERNPLTRYLDADGSRITEARVHTAAVDVHTAALNSALGVLETDLRRIARDLEELLPAVSKLDGVRQRVLIHMAFDMGVGGVLTMPRFVAAIEFRFWLTASEEMLMMPWVKQEPRRAVLAEMMRSGCDPPGTRRPRRNAVGTDPLRHRPG
jgi:lysozyme